MSTPRRLRIAAPIIALASLLAACQVASGGAPSATAAPTTAPSAAASKPASLADWTARQGFGGGAGMSELDHGAHWLQDNVFASDYSHWIFWWNGLAQDLAAWLDTHAPTACWADYHATVRAGLANVLTDLASLQAAADQNLAQPPDATTDLVRQADTILELPMPTGCA